MAKDQQANQAQGLGQQGGQSPAYSPGNQWGTPSNNLQGMPSSQGPQPGMYGQTSTMMGGQPFKPQRPQGFDPRPFKPQRPASSYPKFQEALGNYFKQNPGAFTKHMNARPQNPNPFMPESNYRPVSGRQNPNPFMPEPPMPTGTPPLSLRDQMMKSPPYPGGQAADPRNAGGPRGPRPKYHGGQLDPRNAGGPRGPRPKYHGGQLAAGIRGMASRRNDPNSRSMLQGLSPFGANSPYSRWTR